MIHRLIIRNFLSLRDVNVELGKLNVFIGPNASGKSNLVAVFRLLQNLVTEGVPSMEEYDFESLFFSFDTTKDIEIEVLMDDVEEMSYKLTLNTRGYAERAYIGSMELLRHEGFDSRYSYADEQGAKKELFFSGTLPSMKFRNSSMSQTASCLLRLPSDSHEALRKIAGKMRGIAAYRLEPRSIKLWDDVEAEPRIQYDGRGLARYLLHLYLERRGDFSRVEEAVRSAIPEIEEIVPHLERNKVEIWIKVRGLSEPLRPSNISDGTVRLLAMAAILYSGQTMVAIEEPENSIHPYLLETVIELARRSPSQVVITTHSPYLLDKVRPEELYLVERRGLDTVVMKLSGSKAEEVRRYLEEGGTLGEAWYSGVIS